MNTGTGREGAGDVQCPPSGRTPHRIDFDFDNAMPATRQCRGYTFVETATERWINPSCKPAAARSPAGGRRKWCCGSLSQCREQGLEIAEADGPDGSGTVTLDQTPCPAPSGGRGKRKRGIRHAPMTKEAHPTPRLAAAGSPATGARQKSITPGVARKHLTVGRVFLNSAQMDLCKAAPAPGPHRQLARSEQPWQTALSAQPIRNA